MSAENLQRNFIVSLSTRRLVLIGTGSVIGSGIFVITGQAAALYAGPGIAISFLIAAVACGLSALCYAELSAMMPASGSAFSYSTAAFGRLTGWLVAWALVAEYLFATSAIAVGWSSYFQSALHSVGIAVPNFLNGAPIIYQPGSIRLGAPSVNLPATALVVCVGLLLLASTSKSSALNLLFVAIKLIAIALFIWFGLANSHLENWTPFIPPQQKLAGGLTSYGLPGVVHAAGVVFFAYLGFDALATAAQETRNPQKALPTAILATLGITLAVYVAVSFAMTGLLNYRELNTAAPLATALGAIRNLRWLQSCVEISAAIGLIASIWATLFALSRLLYSLSKERMLPQALGKITAIGVPRNSVVCCTTLGAIVSGFLPIGLLGELISAGTLLAFGVVCLSLLQLRRVEPEMPRPFRVPSAVLVSVMGAISCAGLLLGMGGSVLERIGIWEAVGLCIYLTIRSRNPRLRGA